MAFNNLLPTTSKTVQVFNDLNKIDFVGIAEIFVVSWTLIWLVNIFSPGWPTAFPVVCGFICCLRCR